MATSILIVEDTKLIRAQIIGALKSAALFDMYHEAGDGVEGLKILAANPVDLIVCDLMMPNINGVKFLEAVKSAEEFRTIPFIILSGLGQRELKIKALRNGASDYVTKPFDIEELIARISIHLKIKMLQDDLESSNALLRELSVTDPLTHLYNRRYLMDALSVEFERARRKEAKLSLILMDIDHFKLVNDTYGHQLGDTVLVAMAGALRAGLRTYDLAARHGGEEFALMLPETSFQDALKVAERVRRAMQEITFPPLIEYLALTVSQGVASCPSPMIPTVDALFMAADDALYRAKKNGRNRVEVMAVPAP